MRILAFDTSTKFLSIACLQNNEERAAFHKDVGIQHSEILIPTIKDMLGRLNWPLNELDLICMGLGPGSFTGLRIALATVKGLSAVLGNKAIGVPSMDAIVMNFPAAKRRIAPFLDGRKQKVYTCLYDNSKSEPRRVTDYLLVTVDEFLHDLKEEVVFFGDGVVKYREELARHEFAVAKEDIDWYPRAVDIGRIGSKKPLIEMPDLNAIEPLYLHTKECNVMTKE